MFVQGTFLLPGTLTHNKWHNLSRLIDFVKGRAIKDRHGFLKLFSAVDAAGTTKDIDIVGMRLLQRFMQAYTIARPSNFVKLKDCKRYSAMFRLLSEEAEEVAKLTRQYVIAMAASKSEEQKSESPTHPKYVVLASMRSLDPMLNVPTSNKNLPDFDPENPDLPDEKTKNGKARDV